MNDFLTTTMLLCAYIGIPLLVLGVAGLIGDYIIDDKTGRVRKMRYAFLNVTALVLGYLLDKVRNAKETHDDEHYADDPRPALLKGKVE